MIKKKIVITGIAVAVAAVAASVFLSGKKGTNAQEGNSGTGRGNNMMQEQGISLAVVKAANPTTGSIYLSTGLTGTVEPSDVVYVYAKASGDITAVHVKAGDTVNAGDLLCEIDTQQVETARNSLEAAQVSLSEAQGSLNRMQILHSSGDLSDQEYDQYVNKVASAKLQLEAAQLAYNRQLEYSSVKAPISGKIESCEIETHDTVSQSTQLCVIAGAGEKRVSFFVTERMKENIQEGDLLEITKDGSSYQAVISEISSMVDSATGLFKVKAELKDTDTIATGSTVKLNLTTSKTENAMLIPTDAIYYSGGQGYVYLYQDGKATQVPVEVGIYDSEHTEILSGLSMDDLVVSTWSSNLYEGAGIRLREDTAAKTTQQKSPAIEDQQSAPAAQ